MKRLGLIFAFLMLFARDASAGKYNYGGKSRWGSGTHSYRCNGDCPPMPTWAIIVVTLLVVFVFGGSFCWWWFITEDNR